MTEKSPVSRAHRHRVNRELCAFHGDHHEQVAGAIWADDEPSVGILTGVFQSERMICRIPRRSSGRATRRS